MTQNQIAYWNLKESQRHNAATETEANRHNVAGEQIDLSSLAETGRHNRVTEGETSRHNVAVELETGRTNRANEDIRRQANAIDLAELSEAGRHNRANEAISDKQATNAIRQTSELGRHNRATESLTEERNAAQNSLDNARTALSQIEAQLRPLESSANRSQTYNQVNVLSRQLELMDSQIRNNNLNAYWKSYDEFLNSINTIGNFARGIGGSLK